MKSFGGRFVVQGFLWMSIELRRYGVDSGVRHFDLVPMRVKRKRLPPLK